MKFAVIDIETTGLNPVFDRVTEVGVIILEKFQITAEHSWLVNPDASIPGKIAIMTGIDDTLVQEEPFFGDIASELNKVTQGCIIVGHRVQFDYSFLKQEMQRAGLTFTRKTLCTAEFAKVLYPSIRSYSLSSLCKQLKVINERPHRALPDATATARIFLKMVAEKGAEFIETLFSSKKISSLIPAHLRETVYQKLPATPGVYYFIGKNNKPVYIGKAAKIKNRVLSHFRGEGNSLKILAMASAIKEIRFQETGNELLATLLEDHEIRHYWPGLNAAQKKNITRFGIVYYRDQINQWRMGITRAGKQHCFEIHFHQYHLATEYIRKKVQEYQLNSLLCGLPSNNAVAADVHNHNFVQMMHDEKKKAAAEVYLTKGRNESEVGFIWIEKGCYKGFGFAPNKNQLTADLLQENLTPRYSSSTSENVIGQLVKNELPSLQFKLPQ